MFLALGQGGRYKKASTVQKIQYSYHTQAKVDGTRSQTENGTISIESKF